MLAGFAAVPTARWGIIAPGLFVAATVLALNVVGEAWRVSLETRR